MLYEYFANVSWLAKSTMVSVGLVVFTFLIIMLAERGTRPEVTIAWWLLGSAIGIFALAKSGVMPFPFEHFYTDWKAIGIVLTAGIIFGTVINIGYGMAIYEAPNPGLASAIMKSEVALTYLGAPLLFALLPKGFPEAGVSPLGMLGVITTMLGIMLIGYSTYHR